MSTASSAAPAMLPSRQRPIPLQCRADLRVKRIEYQGVGYWVVKDPVGLKYYRLQPEQYYVLQALDGERSIEQVRDELQAAMPTVRLQLTDIQHLVTDLHQKGLVYSNRPGQGSSLLKQHRKERKKKMLGTVKNLLYLRLPGWDPERTLQWLYPLVAWMFRPWAVALTGLFVAAAMLLLGVQFHAFRSQLPEFHQFFGWPNLIYLWVTLAGAKILHEFGHGLSCKHFGGECHEMGIMLLVFSPTLYCDVSDSWMLKNKWRRIIIGGAGMYVEVFLSAVAIFLWWNTKPGLLHHLALNVFFVTTVTTVIFNANPLMRFDGYYMMSDLLEIPNLRQKSDRLLRDSFAWYCLGIESKPDPFMPETGKHWFVMYAIAAAVYRWIVLFGITLFLYTVLKPYELQSIGITLAVISIGSIIINLFYQVYKIISAPRIEPMSKPKMTVTALVFLGVLAAALSIPLPWHVEAAFYLEPRDMHQVYTSTPGMLEELNVKPGDRVSKGQVLAVLSNIDLEDRRRELETERKVRELEVQMYFSLNDSAQLEVARQRLETVVAELEDFDRLARNLVIVAPADGRVIAPPRTDAPTIEQTKTELSPWWGTPLDPQNRHAFLDERTHLLSIAPHDDYQAILVIDQAKRNDVSNSEALEMKFDHLADVTYTGQIESISDRHMEYVPEVLSNKMQGGLPTVTDKQGREKLTSPAYQAIVTINEDLPLLRSGMKGNVRFLVESRSAGDWLWRYIRQTFHFRL